jgi:hypothetical protein
MKPQYHIHMLRRTRAVLADALGWLSVPPLSKQLDLQNSNLECHGVVQSFYLILISPTLQHPKATATQDLLSILSILPSKGVQVSRVVRTVVQPQFQASTKRKEQHN